MAKSKPVPASKTPTDDSPKPSITTIKKATCKTLSGKSTLTYRLGIDDASTLYWQVLSNSGSGYHSTQWLKFSDIERVLTDWGKDSPLSSIALRGLYAGRSSNSPGFLMACLVSEGVLRPVPDNKRHYQLPDTKPFLAEMDKLKAGHSKPSKGKPRAKGKAATRMPKQLPVCQRRPSRLPLPVSEPSHPLILSKSESTNPLR